MEQNCKQFEQTRPSCCLVDQQGVRDRFSVFQKDFKCKRACEKRASGLCPDDELEQALEDITEVVDTKREKQQKQ